jgi:hypothetical protein
MLHQLPEQPLSSLLRLHLLSLAMLHTCMTTILSTSATATTRSAITAIPSCHGSCFALDATKGRVMSGQTCLYYRS